MKVLIFACLWSTVCAAAIPDLDDAALMRKRGPDIVRPKRNAGEPVNVRFKMELYQVIELQYVSVSAWVIERWHDEFLFWDPAKYDNITEVKMHHSHIWIPDTTLYNTLVMKDDDQRRLLYAKVSTEYEKRRSYVEFLYPAIYKFHCRLYLQFFPFDSQECHMLFGSWTSDNHDIDYHSLENSVGTTNFLPSEGWSLMGTAGIRNEVHYVCCPNNYTLMDFTLFLRRRPLFYLVNLVIPTFIITLIAITGFFTTSSTTGVREEKISLCITTLLSMSILMLMVSDQMPSTSTFIPLISWFYMCAIIIISVGALAASFVISVQKFGLLGERLPKRAVTITRFLSYISLTRIPVHLQQKINIKSKHKKVEERSSTIAQFAKYIFTAGTEVQAYPNVRAVVPANGYANGKNVLLYLANLQNLLDVKHG
ncbi:Neurotransmitter-gated ion-channel ligand binding domain protein [Ancylostoma ceylanicum]|uniref:Neurotransmitter-gated ion-channel ligand binding domain protein n=1 Tax=Ancylostoma ceylanicum TaxID=53326 RepID=A0A0D6LW90_9BILA|nr:Neurotransmitter-gated ion-channel ligand binding domain protein [Ancylostoma ceylanicum]